MQGPQQKGFRKESRRTTQAGVGAPAKRLSKRKPTDNASWGGAPAKRNAKRISTDNARWGGPNKVKCIST